ncbi:MAG: DUF3795 domain-containing protein [Promethearchaeota archaeon]
MSKNKKIAVCGLVCSECKIYNAPNDPEIAEELVNIFKGQWENVKMEDFHCNGCRDAENCWSDDCWIRNCCIKDKNLNFCYECHDFPCDKLKAWAMEDESYSKALQTLHDMKESQP